jgi:hypothetical protein
MSKTCLDVDTKSTTIASAICTSCNITALHSDLWNPWGSLSRQHCCSHSHKPSVCIHHHLFYITDNHKHVPLVLLSSTETIEMVQHLYGIGFAKPVIWAPIANSFVALPTHHTPLIPKSIAQTPHIIFSHYILSKFIPGRVFYLFSVFSQFTFSFGGDEGVVLWGGALVLGSGGCRLCLVLFGLSINSLLVFVCRSIFTTTFLHALCRIPPSDIFRSAQLTILWTYGILTDVWPIKNTNSY